jgi:hypothetical protein
MTRCVTARKSKYKPNQPPQRNEALIETTQTYPRRLPEQREQARLSRRLYHAQSKAVCDFALANKVAW